MILISLLEVVVLLIFVDFLLLCKFPNPRHISQSIFLFIHKLKQQINIIKILLRKIP